MTLPENAPGGAVIADDHAIIRAGLRQIVSDAGLTVLAEAGDGLAALAAVRRHRPQLLTLDLAMPYAQGTEVYYEARRWSPETRIIVFTGLTSAGLLSDLVTGGVDGLFAKRGDPAELAQHLPIILAGGQVVAPEVSAILADGSALTELTARERQILALVAQGHANKAIAERLGVSAKTID
ncbi:MAG: response regulator transcription factor, partial [Pseudomonadota bacterium]